MLGKEFLDLTLKENKRKKKTYKLAIINKKKTSSLQNSSEEDEKTTNWEYWQAAHSTRDCYIEYINNY